MKRVIIVLAASLLSSSAGAFQASTRSHRYELELNVAGTADGFQQEQSSKSLYEILRTNPTASREELRESYKTLAKLSHPDARAKDASVDFTEVAAAWNILSDPQQRKSYDRSLQAAQLSEDIANAFGKSIAEPITENAVSAIENIAIPFLRRTTATTLAGVQAAVQTKNLRHSFSTAVSAAKTASRAVDKMELEEKSAVLEDRAIAQYKQAVELQKELQQSAISRLDLTLVTPLSGLTAAEALLIQETLSISYDVTDLEELETDFIQHQHEDAVVQEKYRNSVRQRLTAEKKVLENERRVQDLQRQLEIATVQLETSRTTLQDRETELLKSEDVAVQSSLQLDKLSESTRAASETVRTKLCKLAGKSSTKDPTSLETLHNIRNTERKLSATAKEMELQAATLLSRANKLKDKAKQLDVRRD